MPSYTLPFDLMIKQGETLSSLKLLDGFTWNDDTLIMNQVGTQTFKATFTPKDTLNYQTVEVDIAVEVVPALVSVNGIPVIKAEDKILCVGDTFDLLKDVTAIDREDGDLTDKIEVIYNNVDTTKAGTYEATYKVIDTQDASSTKTITVTVEEKNISQTPDNDQEKTDKPNNDNDKTNIPNENNDTETVVDTSDNTNMLMWSVLLVIAGLGVLFTGLFRDKKHN